MLRHALILMLFIHVITADRHKYYNKTEYMNIKKTIVNKLATRGFGRVLTWNVKKLGACLRQDNVAPLKEAVCVVLQSANLIVLQEASNLDFSCLPCNTVLKDEYDWPGEGANDEFKVLVKTRHSRSFSLKKTGSCETLEDFTVTKKDHVEEQYLEDKEERHNIYQTIMRQLRSQLQSDNIDLKKRDLHSTGEYNKRDFHASWHANERDRVSTKLSDKGGTYPTGSEEETNKDSGNEAVDESFVKNNDEIALHGLDKHGKTRFIDFVQDVFANKKNSSELSQQSYGTSAAESDAKLSSRQIQRFHTNEYGYEDDISNRASRFKTSNEHSKIDNNDKSDINDLENDLKIRVFRSREKLYNTDKDDDSKRERFNIISNHLKKVEEEIEAMESSPDTLQSTRFKPSDYSCDNDEGQKNNFEDRSQTEKSKHLSGLNQFSDKAEEFNPNKIREFEKSAKLAESKNLTQENTKEDNKIKVIKDKKENFNTENKFDETENEDVTANKSKSSKQTFQDIMNSDDPRPDQLSSIKTQLKEKDKILHQYNIGYESIDTRANERSKHHNDTEAINLLEKKSFHKRNDRAPGRKDDESAFGRTMFGRKNIDKDDLIALNYENIDSEKMHKLVNNVLTHNQKLKNIEGLNKKRISKRSITKSTKKNSRKTNRRHHTSDVVYIPHHSDDAVIKRQDVNVKSHKREPLIIKPTATTIEAVTKQEVQEAATNNQQIVADPTKLTDPAKVAEFPSAPSTSQKPLQPETVEPEKIKTKKVEEHADLQKPDVYVAGEGRIINDKTFSLPTYLTQPNAAQKARLNYVIYIVKSDLNSGEPFILANIKLPKGKTSQRACMAKISIDISNINAQSEEKYKKIIAGDFHMDRLSGSDSKGEMYKILTNLQIDGENYHSPLTYGEKDPITTVYGRRFDNIIANLALKGNMKAIGPDFPLEPEAVVMPFILQRLYNNYMTSLYTSDNDESDSIYECIKAFQMAGKEELDKSVCQQTWTPSSYISDHLPLELRVTLTVPKIDNQKSQVELRLASWNIQGDTFKERLLDPNVKRGFTQRIKKYHMAVFHEFPPHDRILDDQELKDTDIVRLKQGDLTTEFGIYISNYVKDGETDMYVLRKKFKGEDVGDVLINPTKEESENMVTTVGLFAPRLAVDTYKLQPCLYTVRTSEKQRASGIDFEKILMAIKKDVESRKCDFKLLLASLSLEDDFDLDKLCYDKFKFINLKCHISDGEMQYKYNVPRSRDLADYIISLEHDPSIEFSECKIGLPGDEGRRGIDKLSDFEELTTHYPYSVVLKRTD